MNHLLARLEDDDDDDGGAWDHFGHFLRRRRRAAKDPNRFPKVPSEEGIKLLRSGVFGSNSVVYDRRVRKNIARRVLERELGLGNWEDRKRNSDILRQARQLLTAVECF
jgi:WD repeat-containing protein 23